MRSLVMMMMMMMSGWSCHRNRFQKDRCNMQGLALACSNNRCCPEPSTQGSQSAEGRTAWGGKGGST